MASVDTQKNMHVVSALPATAIGSNTTTVGTTVDMNGPDGDFESVTFANVISAYTDGSFVTSMEDSADDTTWAAVHHEDALGAQTPLVADGVATLGYVGHARYVRLTVASTDVTAGATLGSLAILGNERGKPSA